MIAQALTIPNLLSFSRILLTPVVIFFLFPKNAYSFIAMALFSLAAITDFLDGYVARKYNQNSAFGKFLDPLADKILIVATFFAFYVLQEVSLWMVVIIIVRDLLITLMRTAMLDQGLPFVTSRLAKWKTATQFIAIYILLISLLLRSTAQHTVSATILTWCQRVHIFDISLYLVMFLTIWSGVAYVISNWKALCLLTRSSLWLYKLIATCGYLGLIPYAPGTVCSSAAAITFFILPTLSLTTHISILFVLFVVGVIISSHYEMATQTHDPSLIVIDEWFGMWLTLLVVPKTIVCYAVALLLFRFFDIVKPFPISYIDKKTPGGWGVMLDDALAALFAIIFILIYQNLPFCILKNLL